MPDAMTGGAGIAMAGAAATGTHGAGCRAHPAAAMATANMKKTERVTRIRAIRPGSFEQGPINARYG